jgi:hypothetical protein
LPSIITLYAQDGSTTIVALDEVKPFSFHHSLVDYLHHQVPMAVQSLQSRNVVSIMEAAERSALANAMPVVPNIVTQ